MSITTEQLTQLGGMISKSDINQDGKYEIIGAQKHKDHFILTIATMFDQNEMQEMAIECRKFVFK